MNLQRSVLRLTLACILPCVILAQDHEHAAQPAASKDSPSAEWKPEGLPPLPADASVEQSAVINGKTYQYKAVIGTLPVYNSVDPNKPEQKTGEVVYTAFLLDGVKDATERPVTFAFNGGPGAASVFLNMGAIGPKRVEFGVEGASPSDTPRLTDNPGSWLPFSDLVFVDPIGTGYSRALVSEANAKKFFYSPTPDIEYLSRVIYDWLVKNNRLQSRKYVIGESYGGYRGPRITHYLQTQLGVGVNGVVLVSPYLNPWISRYGEISPLPWVETLPSMAAAHLEREHKLTDAAMQSVIAYVRGEYVTDLLAGHSNPESTPRLIKKVTELTGLDPQFVKNLGGRIDVQAYLREVHREKGEIGSIYDSNVTGYDPFPYSPYPAGNDPILESAIAPTTMAMVDWVTRVVGWKTMARYNTLSYYVNENWTRDRSLEEGSTGDLRQAVAADPKLRVLIAHGWDDLSCPFMGSILTADEMPIMGDPKRVHVREYPGGHMFYSRADSLAAFTQDAQAMFAAH